MHQQPITGMQLTADQQAAADKFFRFLMSTKKTFVISGGAGVGKTFLMSHLCNVVMQKYENACILSGIKPEFKEVAFTATTNKAAEILEQALNVPVSTIHSYMGLKVTENYANGKTSIVKTNSWAARSKVIVFIDEASMIDSYLMGIVQETFGECKVVFVGDPAQMAPVNETDCPALLVRDPKEYVFLAQPIRNAGVPALVDLCKQLRETVETGEFFPIEEVPGAIEYVDDDSMPLLLHQHFKDLNPSARVLCYTNSRVESYNEFIREEVRGEPSDFQVGDTLVVAQNISMRNANLNVEREVTIVKLGPILEDTAYEDALPNAEPILYQEATLVAHPNPSEVIVRLPVDKNQINRATKHYANHKEWSSYFALKNSYAILRDKAACTVYKAQGSTYDTVFVDLGNIGTSYDAEQVARMLFVAVSRATTRVYLYGKLTGRYAGKAIS